MKNLFINCVQVKEENGYLVPARLTDKQIMAAGRREAYLKCARSTSGTGLGFISDACEISFSYKITDRRNQEDTLDVLIDGALKRIEILHEEEGNITVSLPGEGERKVEIMFPHLARMGVKNIRISGAYRAIPAKDKFWLFLGDSITQGMHASHPSLIYPRLVSAHFNCDFINMGIGGGKFTEEDIDRVDREPDIITVAHGTNDWRQAENKESFQSAIKEYLDTLTETFSCRNIIGILPIWRSDTEEVYGNMSFEEARAIIRAEYEKYPFIRVIDGMSLIAPSFSFFADATPAVHPNDSGFMHLALSLVKNEVICGIL